MADLSRTWASVLDAMLMLDAYFIYPRVLSVSSIVDSNSLIVDLSYFYKRTNLPNRDICMYLSIYLSIYLSTKHPACSLLLARCCLLAAAYSKLGLIMNALLPSCYLNLNCFLQLQGYEVESPRNHAKSTLLKPTQQQQYCYYQQTEANSLLKACSGVRVPLSDLVESALVDLL